MNAFAGEFDGISTGPQKTGLFHENEKRPNNNQPYKKFNYYLLYAASINYTLYVPTNVTQMP